MRFWDSSAVMPLLVGEAVHRSVLSEIERDPEMIVWWATQLECVSALAVSTRDAKLDSAGMTAAVDRLDGLIRAWQEIQPADRVRQTATRLLRVHVLRAGDALQLGAAIAAAEDRPASLEVVTLDDRLAKAAQREGFKVVLPTNGAA